MPGIVARSEDTRWNTAFICCNPDEYDELKVVGKDLIVIAFQPEEKITVWRGTDRIDLGELLPDFDLTVEALFASLDMP